jgi:hypothetical protein
MLVVGFDLSEVLEAQVTDVDLVGGRVRLRIRGIIPGVHLVYPEFYHVDVLDLGLFMVNTFQMLVDRGEFFQATLDVVDLFVPSLQRSCKTHLYFPRLPRHRGHQLRCPGLGVVRLYPVFTHPFVQTLIAVRVVEVILPPLVARDAQVDHLGQA